MIQDIYPCRLDNSYKKLKLRSEDYLLRFDESGRILTKIDNGAVGFTYSCEEAEDVYLFSVDDKRYFMGLGSDPVSEDGYQYRTVRELRDICSGKELFAAFTAYHLWKWYNDNRYCGKCGRELSFDDTERAVYCENCGSKVYPRINPAVIVGVIKGDSILITRYRTGYAHNALVAGFTEIGETLEQTVEREVMEETGVKVRNIRYYKSQPWGIAQDILIGFFCEADGDSEIHMDEGELRYAEWVRREDIVLQPDSVSLTNDMMMAFREKRV